MIRVGRKKYVYVFFLTLALTACAPSTQPNLTSPPAAKSADPASPVAAPSPGAGQAFQQDFNLANRTLADSGESRYFILRPGYQLVLASGPTQLTVTVLNETREIGGVRTRVVEEREDKGGQLLEVTRNFYAIDPKTGDVFYFGEEVNDYAGGVVVGNPGAWSADGSRNKAGLLMPGQPVVGMRYHQEMAPGVALDRAEVISMSQTCKTPAGEFKDCLVTRESSDLNPAIEHKAYAPGIGLVQDQALSLVRYGYVNPSR
jgi:hypothetical protein